MSNTMKNDRYIIKYFLVVAGVLCYLSPIYGQTNNIRRDSTQIGIKNDPQIDTLSIGNSSLYLPVDIRSLYPSIITRSRYISPNIFSTQRRPLSYPHSQPYPNSSQLPWDMAPLRMTPNVPSYIQPDMSLDLYNMNFPRSYMVGYPGYRAFRSGQLTNSPVGYYYGSSTDTWIGLTTIHNKSGGLFYRSEKFSLSVGGNIMQYGHMGMPYNNMSIRSTLEYSVNDWLILGAYGNYSISPNQNTTAGHLMYGPYSPYSSYGAYAKVFFGGDFGVQLDIGREFDLMQRKWVTRRRVSPVTRKK